MSYNEVYPLKESFFVECNNPSRALKCRVVAVSNDGAEVINMLVTPYKPRLSKYDSRCGQLVTKNVTIWSATKLATPLLA